MQVAVVDGLAVVEPEALVVVATVEQQALQELMDLAAAVVVLTKAQEAVVQVVQAL
jgi:hypothetical protein